MTNRSRWLPVCLLLPYPLIGQGTAGHCVELPRPNILWVVSEDNSEHTVGAYGDPLARTPNLDALAAEGIVMEHAYAAAPVCAPARNSIITGCFAASLGTENMRSTWALPPDVRFFPEFLREAGYYCTNNSKTDYNTSTEWRQAWDESSNKAHWRNRAPGQPFFAVFNFGQTHESNLHTRLPLETDPAAVRVPAYLPDVEAVRQDIAQYYDRAHAMDAAVGGILQQLKDDGLFDETIIFYYADHGGALPRQKRFLYRNGLQVPMILRFPDRYAALAPPSHSGRCAELVNFVDLAPTVLSLAGISRPQQFQGRAFAGPARTAPPAYTFSFRARMDERIDLSRSVTDGRYRYIRNYRPELPNGRKIEYLWRSASMQAWARLHEAGELDSLQEAFFRPKPAEQLFDCAADPDNVVNLAGDPAHRGVLQRMRAALREHMLSIHDAGFLTEPLLEQLDPLQSPALLAGNPEIYPLADLLDAVDRLQLEVATADDFQRYLAHANPLLRVWALFAAIARRPDTDLHRHLGDPHPVVRLAAAEAILRGSDAADTAAWRVVGDVFTDPDRVHLAIMAGNLVADLPQAPPEVVAALESFRVPEAQAAYAGYVERLRDKD